MAPLLASYLLAVLLPAPGKQLRELTLILAGHRISAQGLLLALMLFGAGLGVRVSALRQVMRHPRQLLVAVAVNATLPTVVVPLLAAALTEWHDAGEAEAVTVGLLLMLAMPIAGGAVSWGQHARANMPLIIAAVLGSTLLSPLTIPLGLRATGSLLGPDGTGTLDDTATLDHAASNAAGLFALGAVVIPCLLGLAIRAALGEPRAHLALPTVRRLNSLTTLTVSYVNAVGAFTQFEARPDADLALLALAMAAGVCSLSFVLGACCSRLTHSPLADASSLILATGMNNTSAAAVLASTWFPHLTGVLLPILCYSLAQKTAAASLATRGTRIDPTADDPRDPLRPFAV